MITSKVAAALPIVGPVNYPYFGELHSISGLSDRLVVLFSRPKHGTVVSVGLGYAIGFTQDGWNESGFQRLPAGSVVTLMQG